jgi:hypothetical protein
MNYISEVAEDIFNSSLIGIYKIKREPWDNRDSESKIRLSVKYNIY